MNKEERKSRGISSLPGNIVEAVNCLKDNELIKDTLGSHIFEHFVKAKEIEWSIYKKQVHNWEIENYLMKY